MDKNREWKEEYEELVRDADDRVDRRAASRGSDKRDKPRFSIKSRSVHVRLESPFQVVNVSASGIAFYSDQPFEVDKVVNINCADMVKVDANVVQCRLVPAESDFMEAKYFVACEFLTELPGKHVVLEMMSFQSDQ